MNALKRLLPLLFVLIFVRQVTAYAQRLEVIDAREDVARAPSAQKLYEEVYRLPSGWHVYAGIKNRTANRVPHVADLSREEDDDSLRASIERANQSFEKMFRWQDSAALADLYTAAGQLLPVGSKPVTGTAAIGAYWQAVFDSGLTDAELVTVEIFAGADDQSTTEVGHYRLWAREQLADTGKYVVIWQKTREGWRLHRDIWTSDW